MNYEQGSEFFESVVCDTDGVHCLACEDGEPLGVLSIRGTEHGPDETARSTGSYPTITNRGYSSDAAGRLIRYAFEDRNLRRVSARCGCFNDASIGPLESLGFEHEGTLREATWFRGAYHDMLWYGLLREEWRTGS